MHTRSRSRLLDFFILERRERTKQFGTIREYYFSAKQFVEKYGKTDQYEIAVPVPLSSLITRFQMTGNSILAEQVLLFTGKDVQYLDRDPRLCSFLRADWDESTIVRIFELLVR